MRDERYFSSKSQKFKFTQNKVEKSAITINDYKETFNTHKKLDSNDKETINIDEKITKTLTKIIVMKKQLLILTIIIQFYKLMLIMVKLL